MRHALLSVAAASAALLAGCTTGYGYDRGYGSGGYDQGPPPGGYDEGPPPGGYDQGPAPGGYDQGPPPGGGYDSPRMPAMPLDRMGYTEMAASSDLFEIESARMALNRARHPAVRQFSQMILRDHQMMSRQLMAAANAAGVPPMRPRLLPIHADMLARLQRGDGRDFDDRYASIQVQAHEMALALHDNYARGGDAASLRAVAGSAVPIIRHHLDMARRWPVR
jgi:putative membrane protein